MQRNAFIIRLLKHNITLSNRRPVCSEFNQTIAALSGLFKFPCEFKGKGCQVERSQRCCCKNCVNTHGHFDHDWPNDLKVLAEYAKRFDPKTGFWNKSEGCTLPRYMRSLTCAYYVCRSQRAEFDKINKPDVVKLHKIVGKYTDLKYMYGQPPNWKQYKGTPEGIIKDLNDTAFLFQMNRKINWNAFDNSWQTLKTIEIDKQGYVTAYYHSAKGTGSISFGCKMPEGYKP